MQKISSNFFPHKLGVHICKKSNLKKGRQINKITNGIMKVIFPHTLGVHICQKMNLKKKDKINRITNGIMKVFFFFFVSFRLKYTGSKLRTLKKKKQELRKLSYAHDLKK